MKQYKSRQDLELSDIQNFYIDEENEEIQETE